MLVTGNQYSPFTDENLPEDGMSTEIVQRAFKEMEYNTTIEFREWKECEELTEQGKFVATFPYVKNPSRERRFHYSKPIFTIVTKIFVRKDSPIKYTKEEDLRGLSCCKPQGYNTKDIQVMLKKRIITLKDPRPKEMIDCFTMLKKGEVDFIPINEFVGKGVIKKFKMEEDFKILDKPLEAITHHVIISKEYPNGEKFIEIFNQGFDKLVQKEILSKITNKHLDYYYNY